MKRETLDDVLREYRQQRATYIAEWTDQVRDAVGLLVCDTCNLGHCCKQLALVHPIEGLIIAHGLLGMSAEFVAPPIEEACRLLEAARVQGVEQWDTLAHGGVSMSEFAAGGADIDAACFAWIERDQRCFLMKDDGACAAYSLRPVACSSYFTMNRCDNVLPVRPDKAYNRDQLGRMVEEIGENGALSVERMQKYHRDVTVLTVNNADPLLYNLMAASAFLGALLQLEDGTMFAPLPLGAAVHWGLGQLIEWKIVEGRKRAAP